MAFQFTPDLVTGDSLIDSEHKQLIAAFNNLMDACNQGKGRTELEKTTAFLSEYTKKHFADEEKLQIKTKYPDYINHKKYHEEFIKVVNGMMDELRKEGATISMVAKVNMSFSGWLINHIKKEDVRVAANARSQQN